MRWIFSLIIFLFNSCAIELGREIKILKRESNPFHEILISKEMTINQNFEAKSCLHLYSIIPDKLKADLNKILNESCSEGETIINAQLTDTFWWIPMIYGEECYVLKGQCAQI